MMSRLLRTIRRAGVILVLAGIFAVDASAQWGGGRGRGRRAADIDRSGVPDWEVDKEVPHDVFTFVRIEYTSVRMRGRWGGRGDWTTDWPDADLNFSFRLHEMTSLRVEPDAHDKYIRIEDPKLFDYPFVYIVRSEERRVGKVWK